jgi:hypothetical protein
LYGLVIKYAKDLLNLLIQEKLISLSDKIPDPKPLVNEYIGKYLTEPSCREAAKEMILSSAGDRFEKSTSKDKQSHPILICMGAPGTGKSRLAQSVGSWLKDCSNKELADCAEKDTLSVHITFNSDTKYMTDAHLGGKSASGSLGSRALASYFGINWRKLCHVVDVKFMKLDLCVEVIVEHHRRSMGLNDTDTPTILYLAVDDVGRVVQYDDFLNDMINELGQMLITPPPNSFFVTLVTGTIYNPVVARLRESTHPHFNLPVPLLPLEEVESIFRGNKDAVSQYVDNPLFSLLLADIGGVPRVLEWLWTYLQKHERRGEGTGSQDDIIALARSHVMHTYGVQYGNSMGGGSALAALVKALFLRHDVHPENTVPGLGQTTYGELERSGRIILSYVQDPGNAGATELRRVYMPLMALQQMLGDLPLSLSSQLFHLFEISQTWQGWEEFNIRYDALLCSLHTWGEENEVSVPLSDYYRGAKLSPDLNDLSLLLSSRKSYEYIESSHLFPETDTDREEMKKKAVEGKIVLNAAGSKCDGLALNDARRGGGGGVRIQIARLMHMKHTKVKKTTLNLNGKQIIKQLRLGEKVVKENLSIPVDNIVNVILSNRKLTKAKKIKWDKRKRSVVVSETQFGGFYGSSFPDRAKVLKLLKKMEFLQKRKFSTTAAAASSASGGGFVGMILPSPPPPLLQKQFQFSFFHSHLLPPWKKKLASGAPLAPGGCMGRQWPSLLLRAMKIIV